MLFREYELICWASINTGEFLAHETAESMIKRLQMTALSVKLVLHKENAIDPINHYLAASQDNLKLEFKAWSKQNKIDASLFTPQRINKFKAHLLAPLAVDDVKIDPANDLNNIVCVLL